MADVFTDAFAEDPWYRWRYPGDEYAEAAQAWFRLALDLLWPRAEAWIAADAAAALWIRPGEPLIEPADAPVVRSLIERQHGERAGEVTTALFAAADVEPTEPHALCVYVGVRGKAQGLGLGSAIMRPALALADRRAVPAFLNSTNPRNVPFYERLGYRAVGETEVAPGVWFRSMLRPVAG